MKKKECSDCQSLISLVSTIGVLLRHVNRLKVGDQIGYFFLKGMQMFPTELRQAVEEAEREVEPCFFIFAPERIRTGESSISSVLSVIYSGGEAS